jgi:hypothetical protein
MRSANPLPSEWLRVMTEEVARRRLEAAEARAEAARRAGAAAGSARPPAVSQQT